MLVLVEYEGSEQTDPLKAHQTTIFSWMGTEATMRGWKGGRSNFLFQHGILWAGVNTMKLEKNK
jgi:hypothetical protein